MKQPTEIKPAEGKLGVLLPGFGAVATTFVAGVEAARRGLAKPIGSLTQMSTIRLGKRTEGNSPLIKDFVPLSGLDDLVFGTWDPIADNGYESAVNAGVLDRHEHIEPIKDFLSGIEPMPAAFDTRYVKKLNGPNVKKAKNKRELAEQLREDIRRFKKDNGCDRLVMVWCGSTEVYVRSSAVHETVESFEKGMEENHDDIAPSQLYAYAA
ncbi:MAG: inositol-3-phosphate synthase, partial [Gemmatimonadota bacterium]